MNQKKISEWIEIKIVEESDTLDPNPRRTRFLVDQNVTSKLIDDLRNARYPVISVSETDLAGQTDEYIREYARKKSRVILTSDKDFWDERQHPLQKCFGIICTEAGPQDYKKLYKSLALFNTYFSKYFSHEMWYNMKAFIKTQGFIIRQLNQGRIEEREYHFEKGKIFMRVLR